MPDDVTVRIGRHMAHLRHAANMSQAQVGLQLGGRTQATISKWERGQLPAVGELIRYAEVVGVSLADVLAPALGSEVGLTVRQQRLMSELLVALREERDDG